MEAESSHSRAPRCAHPAPTDTSVLSSNQGAARMKRDLRGGPQEREVVPRRERWSHERGGPQEREVAPEMAATPATRALLRSGGRRSTDQLQEAGAGASNPS